MSDDYGDHREQTIKEVWNEARTRDKIAGILVISLLIISVPVFGGLFLYGLSQPRAEPLPPPPPVGTQSDVYVNMTANNTDEVWYAEPEYDWFDGDARGTFDPHEMPLSLSWNSPWMRRDGHKAKLWFLERYRLDNGTWSPSKPHGPYFINMDYTNTPCNYTFILDRHTVYVEVYFNFDGVY